MSWLPDKDPVLGDATSCDAPELIVVPPVRDLGEGFSVRRVLPHGKRQMVGPKSSARLARARRLILDQAERAIYMAEGEIGIAGDTLEVRGA